MSPEYNDGPGGDQFEQVIHGGYQPGHYQQPAPTHLDPQPYGPPIPAHSIPVKPGLTRRGKTALAIGATVLVTGGFLTWQHNTAEASANEARAQELALQRDQIALQMQKELGKANQQNQKAVSTQNSARQKQIDACVQENKGLVGHQLGATLASVISDCQTQYPATTSTGDMQEAASSTSTGNGGGGAGEVLLIGGGVLVVGLGLLARKATRPATA